MLRAGIARPGPRGTASRILFFVCLSWLPLVVITSWQGTFFNTSIKMPFVCDFVETCRFLFVLPLLIVAEVIVEPWLAQVILYCRRLVATADAERFETFLAMALKSSDSISIELLLILLAVIRPHFASMTLSSDISSWRTLPTSAGIAPSAAFLWYLYVSKPLLALLWLRWAWKYIIWSQLLFRISRLALRVIPTHPDQMGGLGFIAVGQRRFAILYIGVSAVVASYVGEEIVFAGGHLMSFQYLILTTVILAPIVFLTPCLAFSPKLIERKRTGLLEYSALADQYTKEFHEKWIEGKRDDREVLLGNSDIQSLADLRNSFEVVQSMKPAIVSKTTVMTFLIAALLPFTPLLLTVYPFNELVARIWKMVF
jgi:hypothetical protein